MKHGMMETEGVLNEKNALVVGGSSGIGEEVCEKFLKEGYRVYNISRTPCKSDGVFNFQCDVSDETVLKNVLDNFSAICGSLSVLVYSAGFSMAAPLEYVNDSDYRYLFEVNFFAYLTVLKKTLPLLKKNGGTACVIGSLAAVQPIAYDCFYTASKAALNGLTSALRFELSPLGVNAICVMPGGTKTDFTLKRKVYPYDEAGEYASDMGSAVKALHDIEQSGMSAKSVAETVYKKCKNFSASHTFSSGIVNKGIALVSKIMPQWAQYLTGIKVFFSK